MSRRTRRLVPAARLATLLAAALPAAGQIGEPAAACETRLGPALERIAETTGVVRLRFQKDTLKADAWCRNDTVQRIVYRQPGMDEAGAGRLLEANRGPSEWAPWAQPGPGESVRRGRFWLRADDRAMAVLQDETLTLTSPDWSLPAPAGGETVPDSPATSDPAAPAAAPRAAAARPAALPPVFPQAGPPVHPPPPGTDRQELRRRLGAEQGVIRAGVREILRYPWGLAHLRQGRLERIERWTETAGRESRATAPETTPPAPAPRP